MNVAKIFFVEGGRRVSENAIWVIRKKENAV